MGLYDHAYHAVHEAMNRNQYMTEIILDEQFSGDYNKLKTVCETLEIERITNELRSSFNKYHIESKVEKKQVNFVLSYKTLSSYVDDPLVWEIKWRKKLK